LLRQLPKTLLLICGLAFVPKLALADNVAVVLDQARLLKLPDRVATIVIGNPSIADGTLQSGGHLIVTGKGYGTTNLIALDNRGNVLAEHIVTVSAPTAGLTVYRGPDRDTLSCAPNCQRTIVPGDAAAVFDSAVSQNGTRNGLATAAPAPAPTAR
jgi:Flp pilus assembly secretin CpaC